MSLEVAVLALLSSGPKTGYDLAKRFAVTAGNLWSASNPQIYPELKKLQGQKFLESGEVPWGHKGATKTQYSLTDKGQQRLVELLSEPVAYPPLRDPAKLRAAYLELVDVAVARQFFLHHIEHFEMVLHTVQEEYQRIKTNRSEALLERLEQFGDERQRRTTVLFKEIAYRGKIAALEGEIAWARESLARIEEELG